MAAPAAEVEITAALVRALLHEQHADLADLPIEQVAEGWDNVLFRLGDDLVVRLPRRLMSSLLVLHEQRWLPELADGLPLPVPVPLRAGVPGCGYPWPWTVGAWIPGVEAELARPDDWDDTARLLGSFLSALHRPAPPDAPHNPYRGIPLSDRAERFFENLQVLPDPAERDRVVERWQELVTAPVWSGPPVWIHGDLHPRNLLVHRGRLAGVIDFGDITAGDPATDLAVAWMLLAPGQHRTFRAAAGCASDDATWSRAQAWAMALSLAYLGGDDRIAGIGRRTLDAVLADVP